MTPRSTYTVYADEVWISDHAGYVGSCTTARAAAIGQPGKRLRVERVDSNGERTEVATYAVTRGKLRVWML